MRLVRSSAAPILALPTVPPLAHESQSSLVPPCPPHHPLRVQPRAEEAAMTNPPPPPLQPAVSRLKCHPFPPPHLRISPLPPLQSRNHVGHAAGANARRARGVRAAGALARPLFLFPSLRLGIADQRFNTPLQLNFCVGDLRKQPKVHRERLLQQVRVRKRLDRIVECSRKLLKTYDDADGARKDEMASMTGTEAFKVPARRGSFCRS